MRARAPHPPLGEPRHDDLHAALEEVVVFLLQQRARLLPVVECVIVGVVLVLQLLGEEDVADLGIGAVVPVQHTTNACQAQMTHRRQLAPGCQLTQLRRIDGEEIAPAYRRRGKEVRLEVVGMSTCADGEAAEEGGRHGG
jgi:hypothetical protein